MVAHEADPFFDVYDRSDVAYGLQPSGPLQSYLQQCGLGSGRAIDLGAGAGRDALFLAGAGYDVTAIDLSSRGLDRIKQRAKKRGIEDRIEVRATDVRDLIFKPNSHDVVVATTVLDHIPAADAETLFNAMAMSLTDQGVMYVEVHTTEDPGSGQWPGMDSDYPISETSVSVVNYFNPNQLAAMAVSTNVSLRILQYEERLEWDETHGPHHAHGKAILLAVRAGHHPRWQGVSQPFPLPKDI